MKILFIAVPRRLRHFDRLINELKRRGHDVEVYKTSPEAPELKASANNSIITRNDELADLSYIFRTARDYLRYKEPQFEDGDFLRARTRGTVTFVELKKPYFAQRLGNAVADFIDTLDASARQKLNNVLAEIEEATPPNRTIVRYLEEAKPDLVLITPLIQTYLGQFEFVKAAKALKIPTACLVFSWDNMTTKGIFHIKTDHVFVWNDVQRQESLEAGFSPEQIIVTGAPRFDEFFLMKPAHSRLAFHRRNKFDPNYPIILYLCSSELIVEHESGFVQDWITAIHRSRDPILSRANILIRPHPRMKKQWATANLGQGPVALSMPKSLNSDQSLYDAIYYSSVVVGLNTSAQLEAAILGKPVLTIKIPKIARGQNGTIHYRYLLKEHGGFVEESVSLRAHMKLLSKILNQSYDPKPIDKFVSSFIRPHGRTNPVAGIMAEEIERLLPQPISAVPARRNSFDRFELVQQIRQRVKRLLKI